MVADTENFDLDNNSKFKRPSAAQITDGVAQFAAEHQKKLSNCQRFQKLALERLGNGIPGDLDKIVSETLGVTSSFVEQQMVRSFFFLYLLTTFRC